MRAPHGFGPAVALALTMTPALAQGTAEARTDFSVTPPEPFLAEPMKSRWGDHIAFGIRSKTGKPTTGTGFADVCEVSFKSNRVHADHSRAQINREWRRGLTREALRIAVGASFRIESETGFVHQGHYGAEFYGPPKGTDATRIFSSYMATARGRVTIVCSTRRDEFEAALPLFRAIRASITLPK